MDADRHAKEAIKVLYDKYADDVYKYARFTLRDGYEAQDIVQEVFFRAYKSWGQFRKEASERTWLMSIAHNCTFDVLRKRRDDQHFTSRYTPQLFGDEQSEAEIFIVLEGLLSQLKQEFRQVFILRHIQDLPVADVAKILGWSQGKVRITDFRAIAKLRDGLTNEMEVQGNNGFQTKRPKNL